MKKLKYKYYGATDKGLKRTHNEDDFGNVKTPGGELFVVCDGMGGHAAGEEASRIALDTIYGYMKTTEGDDVPSDLKEAFAHANRNIFNEAQNNHALEGMGTTCVALFLKNNGEAYIAHVGDSRCYLYSEPTGLKVFTKDHSQVQMLVEIGEIKEEEAFDHPKKNLILKALGTEPEVAISCNKEPVKAAAGTTFLLCTDGLNDMLRDSEIEKLLAGHKEPETTVKKLIDAALGKGGKDNVTVSIIQVIESPFQTQKETNEQNNKTTKDISPNYKYIIPGVLGFLILVAVILFALMGDGDDNETKEKMNAPTETGDSLINSN